VAGFWTSAVVPKLARDDPPRVVIVAHGNALRSLLQRIEALSLEDVSRLALPRATPLHYRFEATAVSNGHDRSSEGGSHDEEDGLTRDDARRRDEDSNSGSQNSGEVFYRHTAVGYEHSNHSGKVGHLLGRSLAGDFAQRLQQEKKTLDEVLISGAAL